MKVFAVTIMFAVMVAAQALTLSDEQKAKLKAYHTECSSASGVDQQLVQKARQGEFVDDPKLKAHLLCVSKHIGFQNEAGELQNSVVQDKINGQLNDEGKTKALVDKCVAQKATPEDTIFEAVKCVYENSSKQAVLLA
nr:odorant-binding protein 12 [Lytta caraganae]